MPGKVKVDYGAMEGLAQSIGTSAGQIQEKIEHIKTVVNRTTSYWNSDAQGQFNAKYAQLDQGARQVQESISGFGQLIGKANESYRTTDQSIASSFNN